MKDRILLVEDDPNLGSVLQESLALKGGYEVELARDGEEAMRLLTQKFYDLCIFDVMMPKKDGFTLAKELRKINSTIPIIFATAKSMIEDKTQGFNIGGDDYITKPFSIEELNLRVNALLRRSRNAEGKNYEQKVFNIGNYTFDYGSHTLSIGSKNDRITSKEAELLRMLCLNMNEVLSREEALLKIWKDDSYFNGRSMDVFLTKLRKHLKEDPSVEIINIHGKGYKLIVTK